MKNEREEQLVALLAEVTKPLNLDTPAYAQIEDAILLSLKERHRNTRYAAIDKINEIRSRNDFEESDSVERLLNEITGAIHNLRYE